MGNKKNLAVIHLVGKTSGGVYSVAITLMKWQIENGYNVYAVIFEGENDLSTTIDQRINTIFVKKKSGYGQNMLWGIGLRKIYDYVKNSNPQETVIIHAHNVATVGLLSDIKNIPLLCTIHGACVRGNLTLRDRISELINKLIIRKLEYNGKPIIAVSKATAEHYKLKNKNSIDVIYNGVDIKESTPILQKENGEFWIGHVGGVTKSKGWDTTAEAFGIVRTQEPTTKLVCAGKISFNSDELNKIIATNLEQGEIKLLGLIPDAGNTLMPLLDVLVLPSIGEGMPMSILEAFAYGVPVIATDVGGIAEAVHDGENGYIVKKDSQEIAKKILYLIKDHELYLRLSTNARTTYISNFSSTIMNNKYENIYYSIK